MQQLIMESIILQVISSVDIHFLLIHPFKAVSITQKAWCNWTGLFYHKKYVQYVNSDFHRGVS